MRKIIFLFIIITVPLLNFGQVTAPANDIKRNSVYLEAFGQGMYNSLSFDRLYHTDKKIKTSFSAGLTSLLIPELFVLAAPVSYNLLFGEKNHHLELGLGFTIMSFESRTIEAHASYIGYNNTPMEDPYTGYSYDFYTYFTPKVGYRFQKPGGGIFFRATLTPAIAGINRLGNTKGGNHDVVQPHRMEYFSRTVLFDHPVLPWVGISIGWTFKK